jgi:hypothetical protein
MAGFKEMDFTVPAGAGQYAAEVFYFTSDGEATGFGGNARINEISIAVDSIVTDAEVELDLLRPGSTPGSSTDADYFLAQRSFTTTGLQTIVQLAGWMGGRLRVKSGGTAGTQVLGVSWR